MTKQDKLKQLHDLLKKNDAIIHDPDTNPAHLDIFHTLQADTADLLISINEVE